MLWSKIILLLVLFACPVLGIGESIDSLGFASPVDHEIKLTGNFMELRTNHFHAGIDIKSTNGQPGDNIRSVYDGYISRIKIQTGGYGNALYITHPNGYTSVYAHLHKFSTAVADYVEGIQYAIQSFEVDIYLPDSLFRVAKSELIGKMGNSGRSFGPHLHFELRKTAEELPVNPEALGIGPSDNQAPTIESLHLHNIGDKGQILSKEVRYFKTKSPTYLLHENILQVAANRVGLGLHMYDRMDGSWNKNGVYGYQVKVDGEVFFSWKADHFSFNETRYINAFWDYERQWENGQKVYLLYRQSCNPFSYYNSSGDGIIDLSDGVARQVEIVVTDLHKNHTKVDFLIVGTKQHSDSSPVLNSCDTVIQERIGDFEVSFKRKAFYAPYDLKILEHTKEVHGQQCASVTIGDNKTSVNGYYTISCRLPKGDINKWTMVSTDSKGRIVQFGGDTLNGRFVCKADQLGTFSLYRDVFAPKITPVSLSKSLSIPWKIRVEDNLIDDGQTQELNYRATFNGAWIRLQYDKKNDMLIFSDFDRLNSQTGIFNLEVWDHCGNLTAYTKTL